MANMMIVIHGCHNNDRDAILLYISHQNDFEGTVLNVKLLYIELEIFTYAKNSSKMTVVVYTIHITVYGTRFCERVVCPLTKMLHTAQRHWQLGILLCVLLLTHSPHLGAVENKRCGGVISKLQTC